MKNSVKGSLVLKMANFLQELEQEPFDPDEFVERVAWRCISANSSSTDGDDFDPLVLSDAFVQAIRDLKALNEVTQQKLDRLKASVSEEEQNFWKTVAELQEKNKGLVNKFQDLDARINFVATKVVHLGDQLESVNTPRARAVEAQKLMNYFAEFLNATPVSEVFKASDQLYQAADVIHKLLLISQELPPGKFDDAKIRIAQKYDDIERRLIEEFTEAYRADNKARMKEIAGILSHFKGYSQCVDAFIEESQRAAFVRKDIFADVIPLCEKNFSIIQEVFNNPESVMSKFLLNIYHGKLQTHIKSLLAENRSDSERYLKTLHDLYARTNKLSADLVTFNMGNDSYFLNKLTKSIFQRDLDSYLGIETSYLKEKCFYILQRYYDSLNHQKKQILSGGIHDLKRNLQVSLVSKTNIHIGPAVENYGGETFLSEEVAINLLQEIKLALRRCQLLSKPSDLADSACQILDILITYLCTEHIDYALELALQAIPLPEPKLTPELYFLDVVRQSNAMMHLFEKQFGDHIVPLVISTPKHAECLQKKKAVVEQLEQKLDSGLDRILTSMIGWTKYVLQSEQKKTDFKPESDNLNVEATMTCTKVVKFLTACVEKIQDCLDGKNVEIALLELGTRFHRVVYEHLQQFQYNDIGGLCVIFDINEYKKCIEKFKIPLLKSLFDTLYALCNLLVVKPDNLKQVSLDNQLALLDKSVILNFVQLRADYKTAKLGNQLK